MPALFAVPLAVLAVLLVLLTFPVSVPLIALANARDERRLRDAAGRTRCVRCGAALGPDALDAAEAAFRDRKAEMHRRFPHGIVNVFRSTHARCTVCGTEYGWDGRRRALHLLPDAPEAGVAGMPEPLPVPE